MPTTNAERCRKYRQNNLEKVHQSNKNWYHKNIVNPEFKTKRYQSVYASIRKKKLMTYLPFHNEEFLP